MKLYYEVTAGGARVRAVTRTQLRELSCVAHHQLAGGGAGLLLVGGGDGRVEVVRRDRGMTSLGWLWADPDRLPVSRILARSTGDRVCVVMAKANFLVQLDFRISPGAKLEVNSHLVHNTGITRVVGLEFYKDKLVFINQKSAIGICDISKLQARDSVTLDWTSQVSRDNYFCQGLAASTSGAVFTCLDNIATFNDHLIVREPGRLLFWSLETAASVRAQLEARAGALRLCGDLLECYRCLLGGGAAARWSAGGTTRRCWLTTRTSAHRTRPGGRRSAAACWSARPGCAARPLSSWRATRTRTRGRGWPAPASSSSSRRTSREWRRRGSSSPAWPRSPRGGAACAGRGRPWRRGTWRWCGAGADTRGRGAWPRSGR